MLLQFASHTETMKSLTRLLASVMPPHCLQNHNDARNMSMVGYCLACIQALLEKGGDMVEIADQANSVFLARHLLEYLKWDNNQTLSESMGDHSTVENYSEMKSDFTSDNGQKYHVAVRVYSVAVIKILLEGKHTKEITETAILSNGYDSIWASYKDQSLELYVSQSERRRLLLGDEVTKFLEDRQ